MMLIRNRLISQTSNAEQALITSTFDGNLFGKVVSFAEESLGNCDDDSELLIFLKMGKSQQVKQVLDKYGRIFLTEYTHFMDSAFRSNKKLIKQENLHTIVKKEPVVAQDVTEEDGQDFSEVAIHDNKYQKYNGPSAHYNPAIHDSKKRKYEEYSSAYHSNIGLKPGNGAANPQKKRRHQNH